MSALDSLFDVIPENERGEVKELVSDFLLLPREERTKLLAEMHSSLVQQEIKKAKGAEECKYKKLRYRISELFLTQTAFAAAIGLSKNTITSKLRGKSEFSQSDIERWASLLKIDRKDFGEYFFT